MNEHLCVGPDGGQLLGFLSALGLLEATTRSLPNQNVKMGFRYVAFGWRPVLTTAHPLEREQLAEAIHGWLQAQAQSPELNELGYDLPCPATSFLSVANTAAKIGDRATLDRLAAFGVARGLDEPIIDTAFRTMSGAGHQRLLKFAGILARETTCQQVHDALFEAWSYRDPGPSLRFDSEDVRVYALRADDPSSSSDAPIRTVRAANALAFEGLRLLTVLPSNGGVATTLVNQPAKSKVVVRWPLWERPVTRDTAAAILSLSQATEVSGVMAIFESRRRTVDKFRGFTPARRVA